MNLTVSISGVNERDIDLLLLEEFLSSPAFLRWFCEQAGDPKAEKVTLISAKRSVTESDGESDLELDIQEGDGAIQRLLIENKVNANLQPQQAERYRLRATAAISRGRCINCRTILVAPERYFGSSEDRKGFDSRVTYEALSEWFMSNADLGPRAGYKCALLRAAIQKGSLGYQILEDDAVSDFWLRYWELVMDLAPELQMRRPSRKPSGSTFVTFKPSTLPVGIDLMHKLSHGNADLQFSGYGKRLTDLHRVFGAVLDEGMFIDQAAKSGVIRIKVSIVYVAQSIQSQLEAVREGVAANQRLLKWYLAHASKWSASVG